MAGVNLLLGTSECWTGIRAPVGVICMRTGNASVQRLELGRGSRLSRVWDHRLAPLSQQFFLGGHQSNLPEPCARLVHRGECLWCTS